MDSHVTSFFLGNIYSVVFPKHKEYVTNYWLSCCLEGKKTLNVSLSYFKGIEFSIRLMVIKREYLTWDEIKWK